MCGEPLGPLFSPCQSSGLAHNIVIFSLYLSVILSQDSLILITTSSRLELLFLSLRYPISTPSRVLPNPFEWLGSTMAPSAKPQKYVDPLGDNVQLDEALVAGEFPRASAEGR
jgi:hypothetical protein